jgi:hypothetical protein
MSSPFALVHFHAWYPFYGPKFEALIQQGGPCAQSYQAYAANTTPFEDGGIDCLADLVVDCLLENISPNIMSN